MIVEKNTMARLLEVANKCITFWVELKLQLQLKEDLNHKHKLLEDLLLHKNLVAWEQPRLQVNSQQPKLVVVQVVEPLLKHWMDKYKN